MLRKVSEINNRNFKIIFLLKLAVSILVAYVFTHYQPGNDYIVYNQHAFIEYELLKANPQAFFINITDSLYDNKYGNFFSSESSFWNDFRNNLIIKFVALINLITAGNFYLNSLLFSLITFCGQLALYNFLKNLFQKNNSSAFIASFLLPSTLLFIAAVHKDGIVFTCLAFFNLALYTGLKNGFNLKKILVLLFTFLLLFFIRSYVAFGVAAACLLLLLNLKLKYNPVYILIGFMLVGWLSLFTLEKLKPDFKPLNLIVEKQTAFLALPKAQTQLNVTVLTPDIISITRAAPEALSRTILHPHPLAFSNPTYLVFALENCFYLGLMLLFIFIHKQNHYKDLNKSLIIYMLLIIAFIFLFIGYTIPASGAIIRYKSIYLPYLMAFVLAGINWKKVPIINTLNK